MPDTDYFCLPPPTTMEVSITRLLFQDVSLSNPQDGWWLMDSTGVLINSSYSCVALESTTDSVNKAGRGEVVE